MRGKGESRRLRVPATNLKLGVSRVCAYLLSNLLTESLQERARFVRAVQPPKPWLSRRLCYVPRLAATSSLRRRRAQVPSV